MNRIKIALADDHRLFREGLVSILSTIEEVEVIVEASNGKELLECVAENVPDVVLLDLEMPEVSGIEACREIRQLYPQVKILVLTMHEGERMTSYLMEIGANGYLLKSTRKEVLKEALLAVYEKGIYTTDALTKALLQSLKHKSYKPQGFGKVELTKRELEVLQLIAQEMTNQEIGEKLFISEKTVEGHRMNLLSKFGVKNTAGLILKSVRQGFLPE